MPWLARIYERGVKDQDPKKLRTGHNVDNCASERQRGLLTDQKCRRNVPNSDVLPDNQHSDHVEAVRIARRAESICPHAGAPDELPTLPGGDRLDRMPEGFPAPRLHFDECDFAIASHDEIDIAMSAAKAMREQFPSIASEPTRRNAFTKQPECLSLSCHGGSVVRTATRPVIELLQPCSLHCVQG